MKKSFSLVFFALLLALSLAWTTSGMAAETSNLIGKWKGTWDFGLKAELIIKQIKGNKAEVVYRWDNLHKYKISAGEIHVSADVITAPAPGIKWVGKYGRAFKFLIDGDKLRGTCDWRRYHNTIEMKRKSPSSTESSGP